MGLADDIRTLEARFDVDPGAGQALAEAFAEMTVRKNSKGGVWAYLNDLAAVLKKLGRYGELIEAAGGVDPANIGVWDCQAAVSAWLEQQEER